MRKLATCAPALPVRRGGLSAWIYIYALLDAHYPPRQLRRSQQSRAAKAGLRLDQEFDDVLPQVRALTGFGQRQTASKDPLIAQRRTERVASRTVTSSPHLPPITSHGYRGPVVFVNTNCHSCHAPAAHHHRSASCELASGRNDCRRVQG